MAEYKRAGIQTGVIQRDDVAVNRIDILYRQWAGAMMFTNRSIMTSSEMRFIAVFMFGFPPFHSI